MAVWGGAKIHSYRCTLGPGTSDQKFHFVCQLLGGVVPLPGPSSSLGSAGGTGLVQLSCETQTCSGGRKRQELKTGR